MRKVTEQVVSAFLAGQSKRVANTETNGRRLSLHGNTIATRHIETLDGKDVPVVCISLAGWNTPTTSDRLNAIPGVRVSTSKGQAYLNGEPWDGSWVRV